MNYRMIGRSIGNLLLVEAACMLPSLLISLIYPESDATAFAAAIALLVIAPVTWLRRLPEERP